MSENPNQLLSQDEIDLLMRAESDGEFEGELGGGGGGGAEGVVTACDITQQDRIIRGRLTALEMASQRFARHFSATLSTAVRQSVDLAAERPRLMKFGEFMSYLTTPACLNVIELKPLRGHGVVVIEPSLAWEMIDLIFGGRSERKTKGEANDFTAVERGVVRRIVGLMLGDIERAWRSIHPLRPLFRVTESNPQYLTVIDPSDVVINSAWEVTGDGVTGRLNLLIPYASVEPIKEQLAGGLALDIGGADTWAERLREEVTRTEVEVRVELGRAALSLRDVLGFKVGDSLWLDKGVGDTVELLVEGVPKFDVRPSVGEQQVCVEIDRPADPDAPRRQRRAKKTPGPAASDAA